MIPERFKSQYKTGTIKKRCLKIQLILLVFSPDGEVLQTSRAILVSQTIKRQGIQYRLLE